MIESLCGGKSVLFQEIYTQNSQEYGQKRYYENSIGRDALGNFLDMMLDWILMMSSFLLMEENTFQAEKKYTKHP